MHKENDKIHATIKIKLQTRHHPFCSKLQTYCRVYIHSVSAFSCHLQCFITRSNFQNYKFTYFHTCKMLRIAPYIYWIVAIETIQMKLCWIGNSVQNSFPHWRHPLANQRIINFPTWHVHQRGYLRNKGTWESGSTARCILHLGTKQQ